MFAVIALICASSASAQWNDGYRNNNNTTRRIIGGVVAAVLVAIALALLLFGLKRRRRRRYLVTVPQTKPPGQGPEQPYFGNGAPPWGAQQYPMQHQPSNAPYAAGEPAPPPPYNPGFGYKAPEGPPPGTEGSYAPPAGPPPGQEGSSSYAAPYSPPPGQQFSPPPNPPPQAHVNEAKPDRSFFGGWRS